jgi:hypothetical protein
MEMNFAIIVGVSLCAGIGEEIFFRGVVQPLPYCGVWVTAIFFVAIHGYLNPMDWRISIYGVYMTILIAGLGYLTDYMGLTTAMVAHTMIDVVLFSYLTKEPGENLNKPEIVEFSSEDTDAIGF